MSDTIKENFTKEKDHLYYIRTSEEECIFFYNDKRLTVRNKDIIENFTDIIDIVDTSVDPDHKRNTYEQILKVLESEQ